MDKLKNLIRTYREEITAFIQLLICFAAVTLAFRRDSAHSSKARKKALRTEAKLREKALKSEAALRQKAVKSAARSKARLQEEKYRAKIRRLRRTSR